MQLRKKVQKHISVQDIAFSDLLEKFKVLEDLILDYAKSETECRAYIKQLFTKIQQNEQKYNALLQMGRAEMKTYGYFTTFALLYIFFYISVLVNNCLRKSCSMQVLLRDLRL